MWIRIYDNKGFSQRLDAASAAEALAFCLDACRGDVRDSWRLNHFELCESGREPVGPGYLPAELARIGGPLEEALDQLIGEIWARAARLLEE